MTENCGYYDEDRMDHPCQRDAGWGTSSDMGRCRDHAEKYRVPKKLDEETKSTLVGAARAGAFKRDCAHVAGITPQTLRNWLNQGEDHIDRGIETPLSDLYLRFKRARGAGAVEKLRDADPEFVLERSYKYTKTERHEHLVDNDHDGELSPEEAEQLDELLNAEPET